MTISDNITKIGGSYDVVVVGAGNGGLVAAAQLALKGIKVLVLEQHNLPGGFATSFVRGRFEFEASLHEMCDFGHPEPDKKGSLRKTFEKHLGINLEWYLVPEAYRLIIRNSNIDVKMPFGIEEFIDALEKEVPGTKDKTTRFLQLCKEVDEALTYISRSRGKPDADLLKTKYANFLKTASYTVEQVTKKFKFPDKAKVILYGYWCYLGLPMNRCNFTIFAVMIYKYLTLGGWIPKHRSHHYTATLEKIIRESGGDIQYNTRVNKILVEQGQVTGVETVKGDKIITKHVLSNASPTLTYNDLIHPQENVPIDARKNVNARVEGSSGFVVFLGLDKSKEELGFTDYSYFIMDHMDTEKVYNTFGTLQPRGQAAICLNAAIPDCSPPGTTIFSITTLLRPGVWDKIKPEEYAKMKNKIAKDLIDEFEDATGIKIKDHIEEIAIATPSTYSRYTGAHKGIIYSYEPESWDSIFPRMREMRRENYIRGLDFVGAHGFLCHGYSSAMSCGSNIGLLTLQTLLKEQQNKEEDQ